MALIYAKKEISYGRTAESNTASENTGQAAGAWERAGEERRRVIRFGLLLGAILYACSLPAPRRLKRYFYAQFVYTAVLEACLLIAGTDSLLYHVAFAIATGFILAAVMQIAWEALAVHPYRPLVLLNTVAITLGLTIASIRGHSGSLDISGWIAIVEGGVLAFAATIAGMSAAYMKKRDRNISLALMCLWFAQAGFEFGFSLYITSPFWLRLNYVAPTALVIAAMLGMGLLIPREKVLSD